VFLITNTNKLHIYTHNTYNLHAYMFQSSTTKNNNLNLINLKLNKISFRIDIQKCNTHERKDCQLLKSVELLIYVFIYFFLAHFFVFNNTSHTAFARNVKYKNKLHVFICLIPQTFLLVITHYVYDRFLKIIF
jgi:hypothetical protein